MNFLSLFLNFLVLLLVTLEAVLMLTLSKVNAATSEVLACIALLDFVEVMRDASCCLGYCLMLLTFGLKSHCIE